MAKRQKKQHSILGPLKFSSGFIAKYSIYLIYIAVLFPQFAYRRWMPLQKNTSYPSIYERFR